MCGVCSLTFYYDYYRGRKTTRSTCFFEAVRANPIPLYASRAKITLQNSMPLVSSVPSRRSILLPFDPVAYASPVSPKPNPPSLRQAMWSRLAVSALLGLIISHSPFAAAAGSGSSSYRGNGLCPAPCAVSGAAPGALRQQTALPWLRISPTLLLTQGQ